VPDDLKKPGIEIRPLLDQSMFINALNPGPRASALAGEPGRRRSFGWSSPHRHGGPPTTGCRVNRELMFVDFAAEPTYAIADGELPFLHAPRARPPPRTSPTFTVDGTHPSSALLGTR